MPPKPNYSVEQLIDELFHEPDLQKRRYVPDKLAKLGDWRSTDPLGKILCDSSQPTILRNECAESLGKQGDPRALVYLSQCLHDPDPELRRTVIWSIGQIGRPDGIDLLRQTFFDSDKMCLKWIPKSLGRIFSPQSVAVLKDYWLHLQDRFPQVPPALLVEILRAAHNLFPFMDISHLRFWFSLAKSHLDDSSPILVQASLILLNDIVSSSDIPLPCSFLEEKKPFLVNSPVKNHFFMLAHSLSCFQILQSLFHERNDPSILLYLASFLYNSNPGQIDKYFSDQRSAIPFTKGLLFDEIMDKKIVGMLEQLKSEDLEFLQVYYSYRMHLERQFSIIQEMLSDRRLTATALRLLWLIPPDEDVTSLLMEYVRNGEKKYVQAVVWVVGKILENFPPTSGLLDVLHYIVDHERIWHIRRDARLLLYNYSQHL